METYNRRSIQMSNNDIKNATYETAGVDKEEVQQSSTLE